MTVDAGAVVARACEGDRGSLARALTLVESGGAGARAVLVALTARARAEAAPPPVAHVVGITGAPGAGKSTLTAAVVARLRAAEHRVAVVAVDPSSPFSGGAILGDRVRMQEHDTDDGVFVRSMATRGRHGGLAGATPGVVRVLEAAGYDTVIVETVGVGQVEVDIAASADTTVVVVTPGWGDAVQASKAGLLEVGDVFVVNKADRPGADDTARDLRAMLMMAGHLPWSPPVIATVALDGDGVVELVAALQQHLGHLDAPEGGDRRALRVRAELHAALRAEVEDVLATAGAGPDFDAQVRRVVSGDLDPYTAASELFRARDRGGEA